MRFGPADHRLSNTVACAVVCVALLTGCTYHDKSAAFMVPYEHGDFTKAADEVNAAVKKSANNDKLIFRLEQGAILRAAEQFPQSNAALDQADALVEKFDKDPDFQVSRETFAALTNLTTLDYKGTCYDRIMMNVYKALNYMELGQPEQARVELRRAYERQREAVERFAKEIEAYNKTKQDNKKGDFDVERAEQDPGFQSKVKELVPDIPDMEGYALYVNPFAEYLQGVFYMADAAGADDRERAATAMRRVNGMVKHNDYLVQDLELAENFANGQPLPETTYVIFENGLAPVRVEFRIDIPLYLVNIFTPTYINYAGAAFPKLEPQPGGTEQLVVRADGQDHQTQLLCDMDAVIAREFKNDLPMVITKTLIAAGTKAAIAFAAGYSVRGQDPLVQALVQALAFGYQRGTTQADLRTWQTLPKQFQIARFPTPPDRQISIVLPSGGVLPPIQIGDGTVNIVYIKSVTWSRPPVVRQFAVR